MAGHLWVVGLGPGADSCLTAEAVAALDQATDIVGYFPYVDRVSGRPDLRRHASDNRVERDRAAHAIALAREGARVVVVSSGDPGVFAMAAAVFEALEDESDEVIASLPITVLPGITAMLAASARVGAPLGHDFCAINLSDNLKPWAVVERRLTAALDGDFAFALYNPRSVSRPEGFARALDLITRLAGPDRPIIFARAVTTPDEAIRIVPLGDATPEMADMRTVVIVPNRQWRQVGPYLYSPRSYRGAEGGDE